LNSQSFARGWSKILQDMGQSQEEAQKEVVAWMQALYKGKAVVWSQDLRDQAKIY